MVQTWSLLATLFTVAVTAQAYVSTRFQADKVLTWTPLLLVIDAGSMAQILFLIVEDFDIMSRLRRSLPHSTVPDIEDDLLRRHKQDDAVSNEKRDEQDLHVLAKIQSSTTNTTDAKPRLPALYRSKPLYIAILAFLLLLTVFILQILGLSHAYQGTQTSVPVVSWCSPMFQTFGLAVLDGNCHVWPIEKAYNKGVGCILIPGFQQMAWLKATVAGTSLALALEVIDIGILSTVHSKTRWRGIKMRRPWLTMFSGVAVLGLILIFGVVYSTMLPPGITENVWVVTDAATVAVFAGKLGTAGLRGAIIGWNDGVFEGWSTTYFGSWSNI